MSASNKLYLLTNGRTATLDMYRAAVVSAPSSVAARRTHPDGTDGWDISSWCLLGEVQVEFLGHTKHEAGVILAEIEYA